MTDEAHRRVRRSLPARVHLPSGAMVRLSDRAAREAAARLGDAPTLPRAFDLLAAEGVLARADGTSYDLLDAPVRDGNVLRALLAWAGIVHEPEDDFTCASCGAPFRVAPSTLLEIAPFVDGELDDPELDAPFPFGEALPIPPIRAGASVARSLRIAPRRVGETKPLAALAGPGPLAVTSAIVTAMGLVALGRERRASALVRALERASPSALAAVLDHVNDAHYPPRLVAMHRCEACGARSDLDVPLERELPRDAPSVSPRARDRSPDLAWFDARVRDHAERLYAKLGVRGVALVVDDGVPACDDGGEPLLGAYTPAGVDPDVGIEHPSEIRLFYRTFVEEVRADRTFDLEVEIRETIEHELTHHLHDLAGHDPLDDEERAAIARDARRLVGRREPVRRAGRGFAQSLAGFARTTWPIWLLVAVVTIVAALTDAGG